MPNDINIKGRNSRRTSIIKNHHQMELTFLLLIVTCLQAAASGFSQTVDLSVRNAPAEQVFRAIER